MDQVISANFSPSPILQFEPFELETLSELESSLLDDHQKIEIRTIPDELIPNNRSENWTTKDFFIGIIVLSKHLPVLHPNVSQFHEN